jgi:AraC family transcriptional regulator of adaptative response/methylated-DNA-[protein]-cysteine methyltransferase
LVAAACRAIEAAEEPPKLAELAADAGFGAHHFQRLFKRIIGVSPKAYADAQRHRRVQDSLAGGEAVTASYYDAGYNSSGRFYEAAPAMLGMTPSAYRAGGEGVAIRHAVRPCSLGRVLVAGTDKGVCAIFLGDDPATLEADLRERFPKAELVAGDATFEGWVEQAVRLVDDPASGIELPLDIQGTAFQRRVWEALRAIPSGQTASYGEIAARIGSPGAVRAVGAACGANKIAVAIPCHRAIAKDGKMTGYHWGVERKRVLLAKERA